MPLIGDVDYDDLEDLWARLEPQIATMTSLAAVAQHVLDAVYEKFDDSIALARVFATAEMRQLPEEERRYAESFAAVNGVLGDMRDATPVLSLLATRGVEAAWNDRTRSQGHRAIPLLSAGFVGEIPMISRLLNEIGFTPDWQGPGSGFVTKTLASVNGVFYVADARSAADEHDRAIIPATDFVRQHGVRTVFGVGGSYLSRNAFVCMILFCRESILRSQAMKFVPLVGSFKAATTRLLNRGALFA